MAICFFALCWSGFPLFVIFFFVGLVLVYWVKKEGDVCKKKRDDDGVRVFVAEMEKVPMERVFVSHWLISIGLLPLLTD